MGGAIAKGRLDRRGFYALTRDYKQRGGRETLAEAIEDAAQIPPDEAARIAADTLLTWEARIGDAELAEAYEAKKSMIVLIVLVGLFLLAFIALFIFVLATLAF